MLREEESPAKYFTPGAVYPVFTPYNQEKAAAQLQHFLEQHTSGMFNDSRIHHTLAFREECRVLILSLTAQHGEKRRIKRRHSLIIGDLPNE